MKKKFGKRQEMNHEMVLQITSMADIFTILLVFLLKTFSTGVSSSISPSNALVLPQAQHVDPIVETMKLEISSGSVALDDRPITRLEQFQIPIDDLSNTGTSKRLDLAFQKVTEKKSTKKVSSLLLLADQGMPFGTLKHILASANQAGFSDYRLIVAEVQ